MIYEIETKEGKKTIEGLMYSSIKDIHGETVREGDIIHVREYKNMVQELCEASGGEYWNKDGKPGKDHDAAYEAFTKEELKGELTADYDARVYWEDNGLVMEVIHLHAKEGRNETIGSVMCIPDCLCGTRIFDLSDIEIIKRQQL